VTGKTHDIVLVQYTDIFLSACPVHRSVNGLTAVEVIGHGRLCSRPTASGSAF
jgi:hypothetical protein